MATTAIGFNVFLAGSMAKKRKKLEAQKGIAFATFLAFLVSSLILIIGSGTKTINGEFHISQVAEWIGVQLPGGGQATFSIGFIAAALSSMMSCALGAAVTAKTVLSGPDKKTGGMEMAPVTPVAAVAPVAAVEEGGAGGAATGSEPSVAETSGAVDTVAPAEGGREDGGAPEETQEGDTEGVAEAREGGEISTRMEDQIKTSVEDETKPSQEEQEVVEAVAVSPATLERRNLNFSQDDGEVPALDPEPPVVVVEKGEPMPEKVFKGIVRSLVVVATLLVGSGGQLL